MTDERRKHWQQIYQTKSSMEVSWYQEKPELSLQLIDTYSDLSEYIIDVGGGTSLLTYYLLNNGYQHLAVLDIAKEALENTKKQLADKASNIEWYEYDITEFQPPHHFDLWHDRALFHFLLRKEDRIKYIQVLNKTLKVGGHCIIASFALSGPSQCSGLDIVKYNTGIIVKEFGGNYELIDDFSETHITPKHNQQNFNYFILKRVSVA